MNIKGFWLAKTNHIAFLDWNYEIILKSYWKALKNDKMQRDTFQDIEVSGVNVKPIYILKLNYMIFAVSENGQIVIF